MPNALGESALGLLLSQHALALGVAKGELENEEQGRSDEGEDDGENTEAPAPVDGLEEALGGLGTGKCRDNVGRGGEGIGETTILELGRVGSDDVDREGHAREAQGVEDLNLSVNVNPLSDYCPISTLT
jgi:hypothetical protein